MVVRVRDITNAERQEPRKAVRRGKDSVDLGRAQDIRARAQGFPASRISQIVGMTPAYIRSLSVKQYARIGGKNGLGFLQRERAKYPADQRVLVIQDGFSVHGTPGVLQWAKAANVTLVPTANDAIWASPVEWHAGDIQDLAVDGSDYGGWQRVVAAFRRAVAYRHRERRQRGKRFLDTQDRRPKKRRPLWKQR
jgi:hypothetical protein